MIGFIFKELYFIFLLEININSLNILIKQIWKEAIVIIDCYKSLINGVLSMLLGLAAHKVYSLWI